MAYNHEYSDFSEVFGSAEGWSSSTYYLLSQMVLDEMLHEGLIDYRDKVTPGKLDKWGEEFVPPVFHNFIVMTVKGNRIKSDGGWVKHYNRNNSWSKKVLDWIGHGNNIFSLLASVIVVAGFVVGLKIFSSNNKEVEPVKRELQPLDSANLKKDSAHQIQQ